MRKLLPYQICKHIFFKSLLYFKTYWTTKQTLKRNLTLKRCPQIGSNWPITYAWNLYKTYLEICKLMFILDGPAYCGLWMNSQLVDNKLDILEVYRFGIDITLCRWCVRIIFLIKSCPNSSLYKMGGGIVTPKVWHY